MKNLFALVFIGMITFSSCDSNDSADTEPTETSYLPFEKGNRWEFKSINGPENQLFERREVVGKKTINGKEYYSIETTHLNPVWSGPLKDTTFYRVEANGYVYTLSHDLSLEENRYRLLGADGDTWSFPYYFDDEAEADMTLTISSKQVGDKTVENCKDYFLDVANWADEEYVYTLAPGIGFAKEYSVAWGGGIVLSSAKINGKVYHFD